MVSRLIDGLCLVVMIVHAASDESTQGISEISSWYAVSKFMADGFQGKTKLKCPVSISLNS